MRTWLMCVFCALICVISGAFAQKKKDEGPDKAPAKGQALKGAVWTAKIQTEKDLLTGEMEFTESGKDGAMKGLLSHSKGAFDSKWEGTLTGSLLRMRIEQTAPDAKKGTTYQVELAFTRTAGGKLVPPAVGWWEPKDGPKRPIALFNSKMAAKDALPSPALVKALAKKKFDLETDGKPTGVYQVTAMRGNAMTGKLLATGNKEFRSEGTIKGTLVEVRPVGSKDKAPTTTVVFFLSGKKWRAFGYTGGPKDVKKLITLKEEGEE